MSRFTIAVAFAVLAVAAVACQSFAVSSPTPSRPVPTATATPLPTPTAAPTATPTPLPTPMPGLTPHVTVSPSGQTWNLVWSDEFDKDGLPNPERWDYELGYVRNNERQYYTYSRHDNARVEDGVLVIEAHKEPYKGKDYTSASLITLGRASWRYGRIEVRAKLPTGRGTWPAIWMLGVNIPQVGWPECGEIDIMENVGFDPDQIHGTIHTEAYNHVKGSHKGASITVAKPYEAFHVYAVEWFADRIAFFVDDEQYFSFANEGTGWETWPFDQEFYLLINLAIGGSWGGSQGVDDDIFPVRYEIDYVRVYEAAE